MVYFLVIGSNFRFPVSNVLSGVHALNRFGEVESRSSLYVTEPVGRKYQTGFVNGAVKYASYLKPDRLIRVLKEIEKNMGRRFSSAVIHRPLDIDVAAAEVRVKSDLISIPHPGLSARRFMLLPLCELDPGFPGGEGGETFRELLDRCRDASEVVRI